VSSGEETEAPRRRPLGNKNVRWDTTPSESEVSETSSQAEAVVPVDKGKGKATPVDKGKGKATPVDKGKGKATPKDPETPPQRAVCFSLPSPGERALTGRRLEAWHVYETV